MRCLCYRSRCRLGTRTGTQRPGSRAGAARLVSSGTSAGELCVRGESSGCCAAGAGHHEQWKRDAERKRLDGVARCFPRRASSKPSASSTTVARGCYIAPCSSRVVIICLRFQAPSGFEAPIDVQEPTPEVVEVVPEIPASRESILLIIAHLWCV